MQTLKQLIKEFRELRQQATQGEWTNNGNIYIFSGSTMVADNNDEVAILRARGVGGGMSLAQQVSNLKHIC